MSPTNRSVDVSPLSRPRFRRLATPLLALLLVLLPAPSLAGDLTAVVGLGMNIGMEAVSGSDPLLTGLLASWSLDSAMTDASGNGHTAVQHTQAAYTATAGAKFGIAADTLVGDTGAFVASDGWYRMSDHDSGTVSVWFRPQNVTAEERAVFTARDGDGTDTRVYIVQLGADVEFGLGNAVLVYTATSVVTAGVWCHALMKWTTDSAWFRVDNVLKDSVAYTHGTGDGSRFLRMGSSVSAGAFADFPGSVDEVNLWSRKLTTAEDDQVFDGWTP